MTPHFLDSEAMTYALGVRLGRAATPGTVVALVGDLGAGKTVFSRGVGEGLQVQSRVSSPTFIIVQTHEGGRLPFWHADFYRLSLADELEQLGLDEVLEGPGVTVVEWADRFWDALPTDRLEITLTDVGSGRDVRIHATGPRHAHLEAVLGP
jgi:tRNA threonylcarbamoyladenosine biosynthesis protein TsaE